MMRTAKVQYSHSVMPEGGALSIERPSHGELKHAMSDRQAAASVQSIGYEAWSQSEWMATLASEYQIDAGELASRAFNPNSKVKVDKQYARINKSAGLGRRVVYWFGEALEPIPQDVKNREPGAKSIFDYMPSGYPDGFAKIEQDGITKIPGLRLAQRASGLGIYACIHDLNVDPSKQGKGLGTALAYVGLSDQPQHIKSSLYVSANNYPARAWAEKYGYKPTEEYEDAKLLSIEASQIIVPFVRYEADSVGLVREKMTAAHPWLAEGARSSMLGRVFDEGTDEVISMNAK